MSKHAQLLIILPFLVLAVVLWLNRPYPTWAQSEAPSLPPTTRMVIIDPERSPILTEAELSARLQAAGPGQPVPVTIQRPSGQPAILDQAVGIMPSSPQSPDATIIRNWTEQMTETFESVFPPSDGLCQVYDYSADGFERLWDDDSLRASEGNWSGWPARGGADGLDPDSDPYPNNMDAWLECGPFDLSDADDAYMQFQLWLDIPDADGDEIFFGVSADGVNYQGYAVSGQDPQWAPWKVWYSSFTGDSSVWLLWRFVSDDDTDVGPGVWLDDIHVWAYDEPSKDCDGLDPGTKALNIPAYVWHAGSEIPFFSDPVEMDLVEASGASWARLEFIAKEYGAVNVRDYDMMVDSLCAQDIATLAIVDYQTLTRKDWNTNQEAYRNEFTRTLQSLVSHYKNRIDYWEIWNEQDHPEPGQRFDLERDYADLLKASYETIKAVDADAKVIYGGTYGIQDDSYDYLQLVYDDWGAGESYLDLMGLHPYFFDPPGPEDYILDPERYLHYDDPPYTTTLDKFLEVMSDKGDDDKQIWATEVGWNSAYGDPNVGPWANQVVTPQLQADYLTTSFDILFNEVELWNQPGTQAVSKVFWFAYQDFNVEVALWDTTAWHGWGRPDLSSMGTQDPTDIRPAYFGLYDDARNRKPAFYNFLAYPLRPGYIYLPVVIRW